MADKKHQPCSECFKLKEYVNNILIENSEMALSDITKIIKYSQELQTMFSTNDNLEDWVKAKLNHACDYVATVRDYLKFYQKEKIDEKWSMKYKRSIDCSNPKGFGQKAHCRARQLRRAGKKTKSKPVRESYKQAIKELLAEYNSSMAMGALKQLNNDAKELQSMLSPNDKIEDWVKAKLNLAGEYLDDVYHHLDHFGPEGRELDKNVNKKKLNKVITEWIAISVLGLTLLSNLSEAKASSKPEPKKQVPHLTIGFVKYIKDVENDKRTGYDANKKLWFPYKSPEGDTDTIGYGHKLKKGEFIKQGLTESEINNLLVKDLYNAVNVVKEELGTNAFNKLNQLQFEMLVDFSFNTGGASSTFPKFVKAVLANDVNTMKKEYKRYYKDKNGVIKELKNRNQQFENRYFREYFGFNYYF